MYILFDVFPIIYICIHIIYMCIFIHADLLRLVALSFRHAALFINATWRDRGACRNRVAMFQDFWTYEVCFGKRIKQYNTDADITHSLGEHAKERDTLLPSGNVVEQYAGVCVYIYIYVCNYM